MNPNTEGISPIQLSNQADEVINPSTEDKQDDIISALTGTSGNYALLYKVKSDNTLIYYFGKSAIGSATSSAVWQIRRVTFESGSDNVTIAWADGDDSFNNIWDNRESISFS